MHHGRHEGMVRWARVTPSDAIANQHYYDYKVDKQSFSGYIHNLFIVTDRLRAMLDLQAQTHRYELTEDPLFHVEFDESFTSVNPRAGLSYRLVDPDPDRSIPLGVIYGSVSWAQREPAFRDLYNAQDYSQSPKVIPSRFAGGEAGGEYIGPSLDPERLVNIETGMNWQWVRARLGVNYYHMSLTDAIVTENGQLDDLGNLLSANADEALHQGVEIMGAVQPLDFLSVSANLALTDHSFVRYDEVDWVTWELTSRDGNRLGQDPVFVANGQVDFEYESFFGGVGFRSVGKQFTDNSENDETAIDPYTLVNLDFGYRLRDLPGAVPLIEFRLRVNNLFDTEYESVGYGDSYIVGAPRAVYSTLAVEL